MNSYELLALPFKATQTALTVGKAYISILKVINPFNVIEDVKAIQGIRRELASFHEGLNDDELWPAPETIDSMEAEDKKYRDVAWDKLPVELRERAVARLSELAPLTDLVAAYNQSQNDPWFHFGTGMNLRNALRSNALLDHDPVNPPILDAELPPLPELYDGQDYGNWDDYYMQVLEACVGKRDLDD